MCSLVSSAPVFILFILSIETLGKSQYHDIGGHGLGGGGHVPDLVPHGGGQGGHGGGQDCHTEYEEVCQTSYDQQCSNSYKESCCDHSHFVSISDL